jgi:hypothetical protein
MSEDDQTTNGFGNSFLIKDKSGQLKKVQDDAVVDFSLAKPAVKPISAPAPVKPVSRPLPATPRPAPAAARPFAPQTPISASPKAAFYIDAEDELEIQKHAESLKQMMQTAPSAPGTPAVSATPTMSVAAVAQKIMTKHAVHFNEDILNRRGEKILESFFHEARTPIEMQEVLTRPQKIGGLALSSEIADQIIATAQAEVIALRQAGVIGKKSESVVRPDMQPLKEPGMMASAPPAFIPRPTPPAVKPVVPPVTPPAPMPQKVAIEPDTVKLAEEVMAELARAEQKPVVKKPVIPTPVRPAPRPASPAVDSMAHIAYARQPEQLRQNMVDIRQPMKVLGPVEELAEIDLKEFRRLSTNPSEAVNKILEKINLLQEESWQMRMDAVKAWQRSATNQLYVAMGRASLDTGTRLDEIINSYQRDGKPFLSTNEFMAINTLNSSLMT